MDQSDQVSGSDQQTSGSNDNSTGNVLPQNFEKLFNGLRDSVRRFQEEQTPESFAGIVTALSGFGLSGADLWKQASAYARSNPLRVAMYAGVVFFAMRGLMGHKQQQLSTMH